MYRVTYLNCEGSVCSAHVAASSPEAAAERARELADESITVLYVDDGPGLACGCCAAPIAADALRSVADDDSVWCEACYETAMHPGERPVPTVPHNIA